MILLKTIKVFLGDWWYIEKNSIQFVCIYLKYFFYYCIKKLLFF